jgi:multiple sugar transport system ATP-binding protein
MTLGHRVAVLKDGRLQQCAPPRELYARPANTFVAGFIGSPAMSLCTVPVGSNGSVSLGAATVPLGDAASGEIAARGLGNVVVGVRPESLEIASEGIPAVVEVVEELGADSYVFCLSEVAGDEARLTARLDARHSPQRGDRVLLRPVAGDAHFFDPVTGERLPD